MKKLIAWAKELTAGEGFILFIHVLFLGAIAKTIFRAFPFEMFASSLLGGFGGMVTQRYFKNKLEVRMNGCRPPEG